MLITVILHISIYFNLSGKYIILVEIDRHEMSQLKNATYRQLVFLRYFSTLSNCSLILSKVKLKPKIYTERPNFLLNDILESKLWSVFIHANSIHKHFSFQLHI
jgi:hypothetical protein